jgi:succinyl-CoA synthetase beta subunit
LKDLNGGEIHGKIGILGNGTGSVMATFDLVASTGGNPGHCMNLRHGFLSDTSPTTFCDRLAKGLDILTADLSIQVILINLLGSIPKAEAAAQVIAKFIQDHNHETLPTHNNRNYRDSDIPRLVVRLAGSELDAAKDLLATLENQSQLVLVEDLDEAVAQAIRLTKSTVYQSLGAKG